jgi:hypothetical protein
VLQGEIISPGGNANDHATSGVLHIWSLLGDQGRWVQEIGRVSRKLSVVGRLLWCNGERVAAGLLAPITLWAVRKLTIRVLCSDRCESNALIRTGLFIMAYRLLDKSRYIDASSDLT